MNKRFCKLIVASACFLASLALSPLQAVAEDGVSVNVHQLSGWVWTAPENPVIEMCVVNDANVQKVCNVVLTVTTDKYEPVGEYSQQVKVGAGDSSLVSFNFKVAPGFYRCTVKNNGGEVKKFNIGFEPENIVSLPDAQPDFKAFWDNARKELSEVEPCYTMTEEKDKSNKTGKVYLVTMKSLGNELIQGYLTIPNKCNKKNPYPVLIHYMGYGSKPWHAHPDSNPDFIEFVLSIRGQSLNEPTNTYGDWVVNGLEDINKYYYRGAFMDAVRAIDFIYQLPQADTANIVAEGGSQGGALTLAACALDNRIKAAAPWIPFLSDYPDYFKIVHWPAEPILKKQKEIGMSDADLYKTMSYFDIKNLARWIKCPILMGVGLQDPTCPPHTNFSSFNLINSEKSYIIYTNCGHDTEHPTWDNAQKAFFKRVITIQ